MPDYNNDIPAANWYADPTGAPSERWWDGTQWTEHLRDLPAAAPVEVSVAPSAYSSAAPVYTPAEPVHAEPLYAPAESQLTPQYAYAGMDAAPAAAPQYAFTDAAPLAAPAMPEYAFAATEPAAAPQYAFADAAALAAPAMPEYAFAATEPAPAAVPQYAFATVDAPPAAAPAAPVIPQFEFAEHLVPEPEPVATSTAPGGTWNPAGTAFSPIVGYNSTAAYGATFPAPYVGVLDNPEARKALTFSLVSLVFNPFFIFWILTARHAKAALSVAKSFEDQGQEPVGRTMARWAKGIPPLAFVLNLAVVGVLVFLYFQMGPGPLTSFIYNR